MTSFELRQSFVEFFREKDHSIVSSSSLLPDSPNLLFTNAGMNQFVPFFLGKAQCPYDPARAANSQKCIRAGGKHNDLEDVGLDTYHHTFFEMMGNWSFGDYFKKEAIVWAWELLVSRWKFPANRLYATVYSPAEGDPSMFDEESYNWWKMIFESQNLDPNVHIVRGGRKDNFWMMGETGPCGPCSEIHMDLTPLGDTKGALVNKGDVRCIEIWNLVFIQLNANPDGTFVPLPSRHVDTGMGFERVCGIIQGTNTFRDFTRPISNYDTDIFGKLFKVLEGITRKKYQGTIPRPGSTGETDQERIDIAFRVIADHTRTLCMAIADGISPSNEGRGYVIRRILRRTARYGAILGLDRPFIHNLVGIMADSLGHVYTDIEREHVRVEKVISLEEENFAKTLERGLKYFEEISDKMLLEGRSALEGEEAFKLYDTYGFPFDLTQLVARERGLSVDEAAFEACMMEQRQRSQFAQKKESISIETEEKVTQKTRFVGYDKYESTATVILCEGDCLMVDQTPFYAEMGGQAGDTGKIVAGNMVLDVIDTQKSPKGVWIHKLSHPTSLAPGTQVNMIVDKKRREQISLHHTATHLLNWALRSVLGQSVTQKGSMVAPDRLRFDFSYPQALRQEDLAQIQQIMTEKMEENAMVSIEERSYSDVRGDASILQAFGDKYSDVVRVVSIGDFSKELCGGTHVMGLGRVGFVKVIMETSVSSGVRRIEAIAGEALTDYVISELPKQEVRFAALARKSPTAEPLHPFERHANPRVNWQQLLRRQEHLIILESQIRGQEKELARQREMALTKRANEEVDAALSTAQMHGDISFLTCYCGECETAYLPYLADAIKKKWEGVAVLAATDNGRASVLVSIHDKLAQKVHAGRIIQGLAPMIEGKGGGSATLAQAGGDKPGSLMALLKVVPDHIFN